MLYVTTRSNWDAYTANRALCEDCGPDGGRYIPFKMPFFSPEDLSAMAETSFGQRIADILNLLFGCKLTGWDVDFCVGRYPVRLTSLSHRIQFAECWHNPQRDFTWMAQKLLARIRKQEVADSDWGLLAVRIAALFGIFPEVQKDNWERVDIAVPAGDLSAVMAAWYARQWGLPIGNIVISTNENTALWDLLHRGELRTNQTPRHTVAPECDCVLSRDLERLLYACGGAQEVEHYLLACASGGVYCPGDKTLAALGQGIHVSVVGSSRILSAIPNVYKTHSYLCGPYAALCYSGLLDYRTRTGEYHHALILCERSPGSDGETVAAAMGISTEELKTYLS